MKHDIGGADKAVSKEASVAHTLHETEVPTVGKGLKLIRTSRTAESAANRKVAVADQARIVVKKAGSALMRPGIDKKRVFQRQQGAAKVYAYSIDPTDPSRVVRESADGTRRVGRVINGKFKAA
jgi:hypothetical protein